MRHTYKLVKAIICMEEKNRNRQFFSFRKLFPFVPFSLITRLGESGPNVSLHLKNKLIMRRIIFPNQLHVPSKLVIYAIKFDAVGLPGLPCSGLSWFSYFSPARMIGELSYRFLPLVSLWVFRTS